MTTAIRNTVIVAFIVLAGFIVATSIAHAAGTPPTTAPGLNKLQCFDGNGGTCTLSGPGAKGSATLDLTAAPQDGGSFAGVYTLESTIYNQLLTNITQLSYHYTGTIAPQPGNLSYNIPIDANADGTTDAYAFIDAFYCPGTAGTVDIIHDANCGIYDGGVTFYPNWATFIAAYPGAKVANDQYVFVVAERTPSEPAAVWTVNNVKFAKGGK